MVSMPLTLTQIGDLLRPVLNKQLDQQPRPRDDEEPPDAPETQPEEEEGA